MSPHRDDAAFSCAISISALVGAQVHVTVADCFTISEYAPFNVAHRPDVTAVRLAEDRAFSSVAGVSLYDLSLSDAPERLGISASAISTERPLVEIDREPMEAIALHIRQIENELIFVPLAIGDHIDHRIAQTAAISTGNPRLAFYEDLPYAARVPPDTAESRAVSLGLSLVPYSFRRDDGELWKRRCAGLYSSQIAPETAEEIAAYSRRYGQGERIWVTPAARAWLEFHHLGTAL